MVTTDVIIDFLKDKIGSDDIKVDSDLYSDLGVYGDDFDELISDYSKKFTVNMDKYLWYFHMTEEGGQCSIGGMFFTPPYKRIQRIPVTPKMLTEFANKAQWYIDYPEYKLPKRRWDILINQVLILGLLTWLIVKWIISYFE
jgi:hypothetical protein